MRQPSPGSNILSVAFEGSLKGIAHTLQHPNVLYMMTCDHGFDESLIHLNGDIGKVGDIITFYKGVSSYFDSVLWYNNELQSYSGYCSYIFTAEAIDFITIGRKNPFFCYLSYDASCTPLQVPGKYNMMFKDIDPSSGFENDKRPFPKMDESNKEDAGRVYT
jgi:arylsulfatase